MIKVEKQEKIVKVEIKGKYETIMEELEALKEALKKFEKDIDKIKNGNKIQ